MDRVPTAVTGLVIVIVIDVDADDDAGSRPASGLPRSRTEAGPGTLETRISGKAHE
ncbi:hypothetical protein ABT112_17105 [Streptomyces sp. NPDC002055]|uniref:hypothetical protein n=1 Tax=Streptomyces sp. NPDC002055 TaxID=3154534 RepID=UPI003318D405